MSDPHMTCPYMQTHGLHGHSKRRRYVMRALLLLLALAAPALASAGSPYGTVYAVVIAQSSAPTMTRDQAASIVRQATGGQVLAVRRSDGDGRPAYRVRVLLPGGRVRTLEVDALSGALYE